MRTGARIGRVAHPCLAEYARAYRRVYEAAGAPVVIDSSKHASLACCLVAAGMDVRVVHGGGFPALRLFAAAVAGPLTRSPAHAAVRVGSLHVAGVEPGTLLAYDGEVTTVEGDVTLEKLPEALTVYRPHR